LSGRLNPSYTIPPPSWRRTAPAQHVRGGALAAATSGLRTQIDHLAGRHAHFDENLRGIRPQRLPSATGA
ncbi:MAG: hypothetical protein WCB44_25135, partial [Stellaceae bacterium]